MLQNSSPAMPLAFFTMFFGVAVTLAIVLATQKLTTYAHASFLAALIAASGLTAISGGLALRDRETTKALVKKIRERTP